MKKVNKEKEILGKEIFVEYLMDDAVTVKKIKGFVAAVDPNKGLTIKAFDKDDCPQYFYKNITKEEKETGTFNLICINLIKGKYRYNIYNDYINQIYKRKTITLKFRNLSKSCGGGGMTPCAFSSYELK